MAWYIPYVGSWIMELAIGAIETKFMSLTTYVIGNVALIILLYLVVKNKQWKKFFILFIVYWELSLFFIS